MKRMDLFLFAKPLGSTRSQERQVFRPRLSSSRREHIQSDQRIERRVLINHCELHILEEFHRVLATQQRFLLADPTGNPLAVVHLDYAVMVTEKEWH
jgi:hypothetical protein